MNNNEFEILQFQRYCDLSGKQHAAHIIKHNGHFSATLAPDSFDQGSDREAADFTEQEKLFVNLTPLERRTWQRILNGWNISAIARDENVSNAAIRSRIQGNSKGQGGMVAKNFWVLLWWNMRHKFYKSQKSKL